MPTSNFRLCLEHQNLRTYIITQPGEFQQVQSNQRGNSMKTKVNDLQHQCIRLAIVQFFLSRMKRKLPAICLCLVSQQNLKKNQSAILSCFKFIHKNCSNGAQNIIMWNLKTPPDLLKKYQKGVEEEHANPCTSLSQLHCLNYQRHLMISIKQ